MTGNRGRWLESKWRWLQPYGHEAWAATNVTNRLASGKKKKVPGTYKLRKKVPLEHWHSTGRTGDICSHVSGELFLSPCSYTRTNRPSCSAIGSLTQMKGCRLNGGESSSGCLVRVGSASTLPTAAQTVHCSPTQKKPPQYFRDGGHYSAQMKPLATCVFPSSSFSAFHVCALCLKN